MVNIDIRDADGDDKFLATTGTGTGKNPYQVVVSIHVIDENGDSQQLKQVDGKIRVSSMPYLYDIAEGNVADHSAFRRFGTNNDVGQANEILAPIGGTYVWSTAAESLHVVSTDVNDIVAGANAGARTLWIQGLNANYEIISETVAMNGQTVVHTVNLYLRLLRSRAVTVGASGVNEGTITIKNHAETATYNSIPIGEGRSNYAIWTVPLGATAYVTSWHGSEDSSKGTAISLWFREYGRSWEKLREVHTLDGSFDDPIEIPFRFSAKTDIMMQAKGVLAAADVTGGFAGWWEY